MPYPDEMLTYKTRAEHFKKQNAMGGHLWLHEGASPTLVFRAHDFLPRRYELRVQLADIELVSVQLADIESVSGWTIKMKDGTTHLFRVFSDTMLANELAARSLLSRSPRESSVSYDDDYDYDTNEDYDYDYDADEDHDDGAEHLPWRRHESEPESRDDDYYQLSKRQINHLWYGDHTELNWRDRERGQAWDMDADTYVSNWLEND